MCRFTKGESQRKVRREARPRPSARSRPSRHAFALLAFAAGVSASSCNRRSPLLQPTPEELAAVGPYSFLVDVRTSRGPFVLMAHRDWSPYGADRLYFLIANAFYDEARFFRVVKGFVAQF